VLPNPALHRAAGAYCDSGHSVPLAPRPVSGVLGQRGRKDCHAGFGKLANYGRCTRPSVGGFFYSRQGKPTGAHGILSRGVTTVSPYWYIRGRPHAALSGVGGPRERQAFPSVVRLGSLGVLATRVRIGYVRSSSPDGFKFITPTPRRASTIAMSSRIGCGPILPRSRVGCIRSWRGLASAACSDFGIWVIA